MARLIPILLLAAVACAGEARQQVPVRPDSAALTPTASAPPASADLVADIPDPSPADTRLGPWTAAIDAGLRRWTTPVAVYAAVDDSLIPWAGDSAVADRATSRVDIHHSPSGRPVVAMEYPASQSGDWEVGFVHYFDTQGRTRVFTSEARFFRGEQCGAGGVVVELRRLVFDTAGTVVHTEARRTDSEGHAVSEDCRGYDWFAGRPMKTFGALLARPAVRDSSP